MEKAKISTGGLISTLWASHILGTIFPIAGMAAIAKSSLWVSSLIAAALGLLVVWVWLAARPADHQTFMADWLCRICGPFFGVAVNVLYLLFFLVMCGITMRHIMELVSTAVLPKTPNVVIIVLFAVPAGIAARLGIEVITRSAQVYIGFSLISFLILVVGISPYIHLENLLPVLNEGLRPPLVGAVPSVASLSLTGLGIWVAPYLDDRRSMERAVLAATAIAGLAVVVLTVIAQGLFSYRGVDEMLIPAISVARSVRLGRILERLDVMMLGAWLLVAFLGKTYLIYLAANQIAWLGRTRHYRPFTFPVTVIAATMAMVLIRSDAELAEWVNTGSFAGYVLAHTFVVPLLLIGVGYFHRRRARTGGAGPGKEGERVP